MALERFAAKPLPLDYFLDAGNGQMKSSRRPRKVPSEGCKWKEGLKAEYAVFGKERLRADCTCRKAVAAAARFREDVVDREIARLERVDSLQVTARERAILACAMLDLKASFGVDGWHQKVVIQVAS